MGEEIEHIIKLTGAVERLGGKVDEGFRGLNDHISAVSKKADAIRNDLEDHKDDDGAHGAGAVQKSSAAWVAWVGLILGIAGIIGPLVWAAIKH